MKVSPYRVIAKNALMSWNGLSEEEAKSVVLNQSFAELEGQVWATGSIKYAVAAISTFLGIEELQSDFEEAVLGQDNPEMTAEHEALFQQIAEKAKEVDKNELAIYALKCIHDGWVVDHADRFNDPRREAKKFQHLPLEMIGWDEAKLDLLFVEPILESVGVILDEKELNSAYFMESKHFYQENGFIDKSNAIQGDKIIEAILRGKEFYPALSDENTAKSHDEAFMMEKQVWDKHSGIRDYDGIFCK